jgi:hypothetical protein
MQAWDFMKVPIEAEHGQAMVQSRRRSPPIIGRNEVTAVSELPIYHSIVRSSDHTAKKGL